MIDFQNNRIQFHQSSSPWIRSFSLESIKCLIVCRGPVRKEAMEIFDSIGIREYGILLSEKDSVVYPMALAPELRGFRFPNNIHRVPDYMGAGKEEKMERIEQIISIAKDNKYTHIFAGYGFMAEDSEFISAIEKSGVVFMGPASYVADQAGSKDAAKKIARKLEVSVTPGVDNISSLALLAKAPDAKSLEKIAKEKGIDFAFDPSLSLEVNAENLLELGYSKIIEFVSIADLQVEAEKECKKIWEKYSKNRIRFKYIGGGGGKGQRVVSKPEEVKGAVQEILSESKVTAPGTNKNFLIELNIENTRHNEIQLIGNGEWCLALGGRDCSVQMHEQKLLELSLTQELLEKEIAACAATHPKKAEVLKGDLKVLREMEEQSERFGAAVKLNSVSTFESIVEGTNHFFMEVNTRIQVEHRVTEMVYSLKFKNPENQNEFFIVDSLIEAMALLSLHGKRLQKPERIFRFPSGAEVRINATNKAIQPHAGGVIMNWSKPLADEIRDDQGISIRNPDMGLFVHYKVAGAYDSNIALLISHGENRKDNLIRLGNILRKTELRGYDLQTNLLVHYGLIHWILGKDAMFKPSTSFMISYLAGVGALEKIIKDVDLEIAWKKIISEASADLKKVLSRKLTLITRPIGELIKDAHLSAGFIGFHLNRSWKISDSKIEWLRNPIFILADLYHYLNMEADPSLPPSEQIWDHDDEVLQKALSFYQELAKRTGSNPDSIELVASLNAGKSLNGIEAGLLSSVLASHNGYQSGLELLKLLPYAGLNSGFYKLEVDEKLEAVIPEEFRKTETRDSLIKFLAPPPKASSDEIVAPMGGMFYSKEAPDLPPMIKVGDHFKAGQPLFIVEVMKMFNKISAPFSGTVKEILLNDSDGKIISKGQTIFKIVPDEVIHIETEAEITERKKKITLSLI
ncbi:biotin-requiring enzyme [Leptospira interrogans serovar Grippotyphosa str. UI 12769]|uniref:ATP-binding protein n=1 Tax=Leptospira interrogans TaxID=173 RepID=UPI0002977B96|nr:biotin/lipoyl-containing protein [Leptospira interrogans]EMF70021.1 biotin-requiring enzyme [Leptospira interrogans serovar Canicola str. LT1962]EKR43113.1 biotin-requiring enzyme [Leptospira interrogans serovar Grippotyphosa str. UI 08368]EMM91746.1 biotin-requiring enzyme [Leptospira interrogans serovar Djasiman str. LT1649]EMN81645.1 biotin-requiring enzyme [Leptospira interrogans serovar Grippotyphosa str. UI 12764]EMN87339.1 biotin-requiring enzyme [Leptospira interrogans serovar Gripp